MRVQKTKGADTVMSVVLNSSNHEKKRYLPPGDTNKSAGLFSMVSYPRNFSQPSVREMSPVFDVEHYKNMKDSAANGREGFERPTTPVTTRKLSRCLISLLSTRARKKR